MTAFHQKITNNWQRFHSCHLEKSFIISESPDKTPESMSSDVWGVIDPFSHDNIISSAGHRRPSAVSGSFKSAQSCVYLCSSEASFFCYSSSSWFTCRSKPIIDCRSGLLGCWQTFSDDYNIKKELQSKTDNVKVTLIFSDYDLSSVFIPIYAFGHKKDFDENSTVCA